MSNQQSEVRSTSSSLKVILLSLLLLLVIVVTSIVLVLKFNKTKTKQLSKVTSNVSIKTSNPVKQTSTNQNALQETGDEILENYQKQSQKTTDPSSYFPDQNEQINNQEKEITNTYNNDQNSDNEQTLHSVQVATENKQEEEVCTPTKNTLKHDIKEYLASLRNSILDKRDEAQNYTRNQYAILVKTLNEYVNNTKTNINNSVIFILVNYSAEKYEIINYIETEAEKCKRKTIEYKDNLHNQLINYKNNTLETLTETFNSNANLVKVFKILLSEIIKAFKENTIKKVTDFKDKVNDNVISVVVDKTKNIKVYNLFLFIVPKVTLTNIKEINDKENEGKNNNNNNEIKIIENVSQEYGRKELDENGGQTKRERIQAFMFVPINKLKEILMFFTVNENEDDLENIERDYEQENEETDNNSIQGLFNKFITNIIEPAFEPYYDLELVDDNDQDKDNQKNNYNEDPSIDNNTIQHQDDRNSSFGHSSINDRMRKGTETIETTETEDDNKTAYKRKNNSNKFEKSKLNQKKKSRKNKGKVRR